MWAILALAAAEVVTDRRSPELRTEVGECATSDSKADSYFDPEKQIGKFADSKVNNAETVTAADLISIEYADNFKILTEDYSKEQYILTQCGTTPPSDADVDAVATLKEGYTRKFFTIPLQKVIVENTVVLSFLDKLDVEDRIVYMSDYAHAPCMQKALSCGAGVSQATDDHKAAMDAVFMDCSWGAGCGNVNAVPNAIHISASQDPGPLHSAEHIKFLAAFFNKEEEAASMFAKTLKSYTSAPAGRKTVAWVAYNAPSDWGTESFVISMATYKMLYVTHAGGINVDRESIIAALGDKVTATEAPTGWTLTVEVSGFASKAEAAAAFWAALDGVDAVIDETYEWNCASYTYETFLEKYSLESTSTHNFIMNKDVYRIDGEHTPEPNYGLDWYESRLAHPEWAVDGLKRVLGDDTKDRHYFRNIAAGEATEVTSHELCEEDSLTQCAEDVYPESIPMILPTPDDVSAAAVVFSVFTLLLGGDC
jgi:hypothetical protein